MNSVTAPHTTVEGTIEAQNKTGVKVDGTWLNLSRFRPLDLPPSGARIRADVDPRGFICALEVLDQAPESPAVSRNQRDETITRLAVLKAAAEFVGRWGINREDVKSDHVLVLADKWLAWVNQ